jgi:uracil-DNA glycosylase
VTLSLDPRQRAMLQEMGVRLFDPLPDTVTTPVQAPAAARPPSAPAARAPVAVPSPAPLPQAPGAPGPAAALDWSGLADAVAGCRGCKLCTTRRNTVFGAGDPHADWLIVGDAPGNSDEQQGAPFADASGKLLDSMLRALGLDRQRVYLTNVLKCRPPANRNPEPEELAQCEPHLRRQVELLQPRIILAMGRFAMQTLLQSQEPIGKLRGRLHAYHGVPVVVTYPPDYLLRNLPDKAKAWADLCLAMDALEGAVPASAAPAR